MGKLRFIDLFCGAGGMSLGLEMTNKFEIVGAIDFWQPAIDTFRYNHPFLDENKVICADVSNIFERNGSKVNGTYDLALDNIDVVVGGPPCQGLSLAGKRLIDDPRNQLFLSFVDAVNIIKPKAFIMENVPGLLSMNGGAINKAILNAFSEIGYNHFSDHAPQILKAETYGVPQIRRRLFYVGFRDDISPKFENWPPKPIYKEYKSVNESKFITGDLFSDQIDLEVLSDPINVEEAIGDLPKLLSGEGGDEMNYTLTPITNYQKEMRLIPKQSLKLAKVFNHEAPKHTEKLIKMIKLADQGESVDPKYTDSKKWKSNKPSYTVKALGAGGGSTNRRAFHYDPNQPRASTVRENARVQSFPDYYRFLGSKTNQMTQVGNAVPPFLARAIGEAIYAKLEKK